MARQISEIQQQILDSIAADSVLGGLLTSQSKRAIYRLLAFVVATAISILENIMEILKADIESVAAKASPATPTWLQDQVLKFQYDASNPQVVQLIDFAPQYPVVDEALRIISRCSVTTTTSNKVLIKAATGEPPAALTAPQLAALQSYVDIIGIAGVDYVCSSLPADKISIQGAVYFQGQYSQVIKDRVIAAIEGYLASIPFNGQVKISDIENAIRDTVGVNDVFLDNVLVRSDATAFANGTYLIQNKTNIARLWNTVSGYIVGETTTNNTLQDTLTFIAE